jgi:soluble lytic murein transglycosylase
MHKPGYLLREFFILILLTTFYCSDSFSANKIDCESVINDKNHLSDPKQRYRVGYCLIKKNYNEEGLSFLKDIEKDLPLITEYILYHRAKANQSLGNYQQATIGYNKILSDFPQSPLNDIVLLNLSMIHLRYKRYVEAENIYQNLINGEKDPEQKAFYLYRIAFIQKSQKKYEEAQKNFIKLWTDYPTSKYGNPSYKEALSIQSKHGLKLRITETDYLKRAQIFFASSQWKSAIENYNKSIQTQTVLINKAVCYINSDQYSQAIAILNNIESARSTYWRANVLSKQNKNTSAANTYMELYAKYPKSYLAPEALFNAAKLHEINKNNEKASNIYELLITKYPKSDFAEEGSWNLGWIYYKKGDLNRAKKTFSAFINAGSSFNASRSEYWTARILESLGLAEQAIKIYNSLASKYFPSYYPYLARLRTGYDTVIISSPIEIISKDSANPNRAKAELLIELGMLDNARMEVDKINKTAKNSNDYVDMSVLYSKVDDFYNSIKVVQGIDHPIALQLSYPQGYREFVEMYSKRYGVDKYMIYSIIREESRYQADVVSPAKAIGLMQLLPVTGLNTAKDLGIKNFKKDDLYKPDININLGTHYFKTVLDEFGGNVFYALGSYNAGPHRVTEWIGRNPNLDMDEFVEEIPFRETRNYVRRVLRTYGAYKVIYDKNKNITSIN